MGDVYRANEGEIVVVRVVYDGRDDGGAVGYVWQDGDGKTQYDIMPRHHFDERDFLYNLYDKMDGA